LSQKKGEKVYRIRLVYEEVQVLRLALTEYLAACRLYAGRNDHYKIASRLYARLAHLKPGIPKGIRIYKKS